MRIVSLRTKLIVASLGFVLLPIFGIGGYAYNAFEQILSDNIVDTTADRVHQVNLNIVNELNMMVSATSSIISDDNVRHVLENPPETTRELLDHISLIDRKFLDISIANLSESVTFTLMDNYGNMYTNWGQTAEALEQIRQADWFHRALGENGYMVWELNHESYLRPGAGQMTTLAMVIRDRNLIHNIGVLIISRPSSHFLQVMEARNESSLGFIADNAGNILGQHTDRIVDIYPSISAQLKPSSSQFMFDMKGETYEVIAKTVPITDWKIVQVINYSEILKPVTKIRKIALMLLLVSMLLFIAIIVFISSMVTRSLRQLGSLMKQVESGNLEVAFAVRSRDEVGLLGRTFNHMLTRLRGHLEKEIALERSKEQAKLEALQAQINPHFLHNTLNTVKWMSIMAGTKQITDMLLSLGSLLNMSSNRGPEAIRLQDEVENVRHFLTIQKYRFGDTIEVVEQFAPDSLDCLVPKLSLQPLVENVYQHGLFINGGKMVLSSTIAGGELLVKVSDTGSTLEPARMNEIRKRLAEGKSDSFSGIGIVNVHRRIQLMFGSTYGLRFERNEHQGTTCFTIQIPCRRDEDEGSSGSH